MPAQMLENLRGGGLLRGVKTGEREEGQISMFEAVKMLVELPFATSQNVSFVREIKVDPLDPLDPLVF